EVLIPVALECRPDLIAYRLGVQHAVADVALKKAERFQNLYLFYTPFSYVDNSRIDLASARGWGIGGMLQFPVFDRNQGNIQRSQLNVIRTQREVAQLERQVITEVQQARQEYDDSLQAVHRIAHDILPLAVQMRQAAWQKYQKGATSAAAFENAQRTYYEVVRQLRDALIRHRRSMLNLNTAIGRRILP
ncbi:MAG: TolC family protein, partial [Isosphaeraceae bacterium]|nr:TolC family protein [Isosphaeraceae bacterium]